MSTSIKRSPIAGLPQPQLSIASNPDAVSSTSLQLDLMRSLRRRPRLVAAVAASVFILIFGFGLSRKPEYQAQSLTYIEPLASKVLSDGASSGTFDSSRYDSYLQQQMQTAVRPDILAAAIASLPPFVWQRPGEQTQAAVARLQSALKVERVSTSYQLAISLADANPETAAAVVNAVTNTYLEQGRKDEHAVIDQRLQLLGEERQRIQQLLDEDRLEQASLGKALGVANLGGLVSQYDQQIAGVQTEVAGAREAKDIAAAQLASLESPGAGLSPALAAAAEDLINTDVGLNSMKSTITSRKAVLSTQMAGLTPTNPIYRQDQAEIADLDRSLDAMTTELRAKTARRLQDKLQGDLRRTSDVEGRLNAQLQHQTTTATNAAPKVQRLSELAADLQRLNARYGVVDDAIRGLQLESNGPGSAHLSVAASVPVSPGPSKRKLILLLALPLAFCSGLLAAILASRLDPRIFSGSDVARVLGFQPIGIMPAQSEVSSQIMQEYTLRLAAGLQSAYRSSGAQSFLFTSTTPSVQIGPFIRAIEVVLRSLGFKAVVLHASSVLQTASQSQAVSQPAQSRSSSLVRTIDGVRQGYAAEEIERLKLTYDLLLIDAPPLLHSAETEYLARCADATILIAESGVTLKPELFQSALLLQHLNVAGVGAVLHELHLKDADAAFCAAIAAAESASIPAVEEPALRQPANPPTRSAIAEPATSVQAAMHAVEPASEPAPQTPVPTQVLPAETFMRHNQEQEAAYAEHVGAGRSVQPAAEPEHPAEVISSSPQAPPIAPSQEQNAAAVTADVEEQNQVRLWKELTKRLQAEAPEPEPPQAPQPVHAASSPQAPEPVLYFEDRLRARKSQDPVISRSAAAESFAAESFAAEPYVPSSAAPSNFARSAAAESYAEQSAEQFKEHFAEPFIEQSSSYPDPVPEPVTPALAYQQETPLREIEQADIIAAQHSFSTYEADSFHQPFFLNPAHEEEPELPAEPVYDPWIETASQQERSILESGTETHIHPDTPLSPPYQELPPTAFSPSAFSPDDTDPKPESKAEPEFVLAEQVSSSAGHTWSNARALDALEAFRARAAAAEIAAKDLGLHPGAASTAEPILTLEPSEEVSPASTHAGIPIPALDQDQTSTLAEDTAPAVEQELPEAATSRIPAKREPTPAKMEWFTLRFRGTSERVLRLVPSDEGNPGPDDETSLASSDHPSILTPNHTEQPASATAATPVEEPQQKAVEDENEGPAQMQTPSSTSAVELSEPAAGINPFTSHEDPQEVDSFTAEPSLEPEPVLQESAAPTMEPEHVPTYPYAEAAPNSSPQSIVSDQGATEPSFASIAASVTELTPLAAIPAPVEPAPPPRIRLNRWSVSDHAPAESTPEEELQPQPAVSSPAPDAHLTQQTARFRQPEAPAASVDRFAPARLIEELRRKPGLATQPPAMSLPPRAWHRRSVSAPVEERLEPKAPSLTRRWQMLSRFDQSTVPIPAETLHTVSTETDQGDR